MSNARRVPPSLPRGPGISTLKKQKNKRPRAHLVVNITRGEPGLGAYTTVATKGKTSAQASAASTTVLIKAKQSGAKGGPGTTSSDKWSGRGTSLNDATLFDITQALTSPSARKITEERDAHGPFSSWAQLRIRVEGIGEVSPLLGCMLACVTVTCVCGRCVHTFTHVWWLCLPVVVCACTAPLQLCSPDSALRACIALTRALTASWSSVVVQTTRRQGHCQPRGVAL